MPDVHAIVALTSGYGYLGLLAAVFVGALGVGVPIPVTALLLTLGALSVSRGGSSFALVAIAAVAGAVGGHLVDYWCGRLGSRLLQRWFPKARPSGAMGAFLSRTLRLRNGRTALVFLSRFLLTSIASPVSLLAGTTRMAFGFYLLLEVTGEAIYVLGNLALGRIFGARLLAHGGVPLAFWVAVAALTLAPLLLARLAMVALARRRGSEPGIASATPQI